MVIKSAKIDLKRKKNKRKNKDCAKKDICLSLIFIGRRGYNVAKTKKIQAPLYEKEYIYEY